MSLKNDLKDCYLNSVTKLSSEVFLFLFEAALSIFDPIVPMLFFVSF